MPNTVGNKGKYIQEISEGTTKQISSSFLLIAFMNVTELQIIWQNLSLFTSNIAKAGFCSVLNKTVVHINIRWQETKPRKGLESELIKVLVWPLLYPVCKQTCFNL